MAVEWTAHRFSGGALALDVANTVVLRHDAARLFDRFDDPAELARFAEAAGVHRWGELRGARLQVEDGELLRPSMIALREAVDALFRSVAAGETAPAGSLSRVLIACAGALEGHDVLVPGRVARTVGDVIALEAATALSALSLLEPARLERIRICPKCGWLFVDRSRNASRIWCDMAVCGNRAKARRHYERGQSREARSGAARG